LASYKTSAYHQEDLGFLSAVGEQLSCAVANSRRHEDARERIRWLEMMHNLEDALGRTLQVEEMLRIASDHAVQAMKADRILAVLPEEGVFKRGGAAEERCCLAGVGIRPGGNWHRLADFGPLVNAPVERMAPMLSRLVVEEAIAGTPLETLYHGEGIRSLAVMPILSGGVCLGILLVGWRREGAISQESLQMLQDLAEHLGVGLRNANLAAALKAAK
jgi:GAF domain-containing protein